MTIDVSPTTPTPSHHISLEDANGNKYGLILYPTARSVQRRPKQSSQYTPFTQSDWSGGRGLKFAESDPSRYADSKRLITRRIGDVMLAGQETYSTGYRAAEQFMPADSAGLSWQALTGGNRFAAFKLTASVTSNRAKLYFWVRRRGTPNGAFEARLKNDNAGDPGSQLRLVSATTSDIDDTISLLYEFTFVSVQAVTNAVNYWVEAAGASGDDATNHWEVGVDAARSQALTKASPTAANGTWVNTTYDLFYRLVDDTSILGALKFIYKGQTYMVTRPANAGTPKLYMNGYRGVATGTQSTTTLQDTTQAWAVNELAGKLLFFVDGSASELSRPYVTITGNTNNTITFPQIGAAPVTAKTAYVILGLNKWIEITGHGLTTVTDVADMGEVLYFAQGDSVVMRRMHEYNLGGVWTREFADEDNYAKLLKIWRHPTRGLMILKANDYDNSNRPSVAMAPSMPWGSRLSFPWLLDACEATTNWTFLTGVTGSLDTSIYKTGSGSIKMQVTGSPTLLGYRKWTAGISLKNQKRIRLWVLSNTTLDKGDLKLRISAATDCSSAIQTLDIPVLNANEWTQIELAFKDHDQASIGKVKSIGFVKSSSVGTIWVDGLETLPGESEVLLGSDLERVTGLELYGDPSVPWVFRTKSIGSIENGTFNPIPIREYEQVENIHNGQAHVVFDVYLFFSFLQGVESYYRNNLDDVGPNRDEGLPNNRQGYIVSMVGYPGRFYVACDGGPNGYSSIFEFKGGGYHEVYRCDAKGKSIGDLFVQVIPGETCDRLWFSEGSDTLWIPLPGNTANEATDGSYRFTHEGVLETGWFSNDDLQLLISGVKLLLEGMDSDTKIEWDYKVDNESGAWTPVTTPFTAQPAQTLALGITGTRLKLRFRLQSAKNTKTPRLRRMTARITTMPETRFAYSMQIVYMDNGVDLLNNKENYTRAETLINQLDAWKQSLALLTMHSVWSPFDNKIVYVEPSVLNPQQNLPDQQQEKLSATLTLVEPE